MRHPQTLESLSGRTCFLRGEGGAAKARNRPKGSFSLRVLAPEALYPVHWRQRAALLKPRNGDAQMELARRRIEAVWRGASKNTLAVHFWRGIRGEGSGSSANSGNDNSEINGGGGVQTSSTKLHVKGNVDFPVGSLALSLAEKYCPTTLRRMRINEKQYYSETTIVT